MIKPDWDIFKAKFSDNPQWYFEWMCYLLFCRECGRPYGVDGYKNQAGIEMQPITVNKDVIGIQAKFYSTPLASHKKTLINMLDNIHEKYPKLNKLIFYSNAEWGQGVGGGKSKPQIEIEELAEKYNITIEWRLKSYFKSPFVALENNVLVKHFFTPFNMENVYERVNTLNKLYEEDFNSLKDGLIIRSQLDICLNYIDSGKSFVIHGKAGRGKSGVTQNIVHHLKEKGITYIAINLDKWSPENGSKTWSERLELPSSVEECLSYVSNGEKAVLILDQLDALRWTSAHSKTSLDVCREIIDTINVINTGREQKISIVLVCRTYDLDNDNSIRLLFKNNDKNQTPMWKKVSINELSEIETQRIIGVEYKKLNKKLQEVLRIPSNIYIWQRILDKKIINECESTYQLVNNWWSEIKKYGTDLKFNEKVLEEDKNRIVDVFQNSGRLSELKRRLGVNDSTVEFLISQGFLVESDNKISFAHQSILDCLLAQKMEDEFLEGNSVEKVLGDNQIPSRRFQLQLLLQMLLEGESQDFLDFGIELIKSDKIRYSFKFVFYEILNQVDYTNTEINKYVLVNCENELIINNVLLNNKIFIRLLMKKGILDEWIIDGGKINSVLFMLRTLSSDYNSLDIAFIKKHLEVILCDDRRLNGIFQRDVNEDTAEVFEFRMQVYNKYPQKISRMDFDISRIFEKSQSRAIKLFEFILENKIYDIRNSVVSDNDFTKLDEYTKIEDSRMLLDELLQFIPFGSNYNFQHSRWSSYVGRKREFERYVVNVVKLACKDLAINKPEEFFEIFEPYMGKGYCLHNEIILFAFQYVDICYSDKIMEYLALDFENNALEYTSGTDNQLTYTKNVVNKHSVHCSNEIFKSFENKLYYFKSSDMLETARSIFSYRKQEKNYVLRSYHGDLQRDLLGELDPNRISEKICKYIKVLERRFSNMWSIYEKSKSHGVKGVASPISGKNLSDKQWLGVLSNKQISEKSRMSLEEKNGCYIDRSLSEFGNDFQKAVSNEPERFIEIYLSYFHKIRIEYFIYLLNGVSYCGNIEQIPQKSLEKLISLKKNAYRKEHLRSICEIIRKNSERNWSDEVIDLLFDISLKKTDYFKKFEYATSDDSYIKHIRGESLNHTKCIAISGLSMIMRNKSILYEKLKEVIVENIYDEYIPVRYAVFELLRAMYIIDKNFAIENMVSMFEDNILLTGADYANHFIYWISKEINMSDIIIKMLGSTHKELLERGTCLMVEMHLRDGIFNDIINEPNNFSLDQKKIIIQTAVIYFDRSEYKNRCKEIIYLYKNEEFDFEISRLFYDEKIALNEDKEFIIEIKDIGGNVLSSFCEYLSEQNVSLIEYADVVISLCEGFIIKKQNELFYVSYVSKLLFGLYDEIDNRQEYREIGKQCLDLIDIMFEHNIGNTRTLSKQIMDR
ncbi:MAG: hypothetical protein R3Y09_08465 [Clostridia bacterium]